MTSESRRSAHCPGSTWSGWSLVPKRHHACAALRIMVRFRHETRYRLDLKRSEAERLGRGGSHELRDP